MAKEIKNGRINESTDLTIDSDVQVKIIKYAQQRLNQSGAQVLIPVKEMFGFDDPMDGMISFYYLDTIAEDEEASEDESGYTYIEEAVSDIADFIQKQGYIMDDESDDPLIFIDENYDDEDEDSEDMNESTVMNEAASIKKSDRYREFNLLPKGKGWMDPIELTNKDAGFYAIAGTAYDESDRNNEDEWGIVVILAPLDEKYEDVVITGSFYDYDAAAEGIMDRLSRAKTPSDVARILKNQDFLDDYDDDESEFLSALTKSYRSQNESTMMINESAAIIPCDPEILGLDLLGSNNPFDFEPVYVANTALGFSAVAGVATGANPDADFIEDDCSIEVLVFTDNENASSDVLVAEYYDVDYKAMSVMNELAKVTNLTNLTNILVKEGFTGAEDGPFDFVESLEAANSMNEATEVPDGRMTVELDDTDVIEGDTLLLAELTDDVFNAVNTVLDELDPDADVEITIDNEDLLQLAVVSDEDLDDDAFDQVLSELLEDMDLEDIVADMTDSEPIEDPDDEDFGRVIQYINFYQSTGATVVPDNSVMEDNVDVIEDEDVINESASTKTDFIELLEKLADEFKKEFKSNPDVEQTSFSFVKKGKDKVVIQAIADSVNPGSRALSNYMRFLDDNGVEYKVLKKFEYYRGALNCTIYTTIKITDIKSEESINESFKLNTDLTKFVDKLADSFFGSIKDANFLNLEDEDGNLYFQVSTGDKSYSRKLLTNFLAFLAKKNVDFDLVNKVNVTGNSTFWNATVTVTINNKQGSQVQYRNELNESTNVDSRISHYVEDLNFKSGVKFLEGDDKIEKVLKAISPKLDIRFYGLDKLPWTTYKVDGKDQVAVFGISDRLFTPMCIAITDGKNISDFISNSKSILVFTNKKLQDWNNVVIPVRIMNNLAKATDRASKYKAIKSLLTSYQKQVYNYEQYDESYSINKASYKDADEDLSIDKTTATKVLKAVNTILTKAGRPLDNLEKVFRINYPRPGIIEDGLVLALKSAYGIGIGNESHDIDTQVERKLEKSFDITYITNRGNKDYYATDKFSFYSQNDIEKYFKTGKVRDYEGQMSILDAKEDIINNAIDDITEFIESHPKYKLNLWKYDSVKDTGNDSIEITIETKDVNDAKKILIDADNYIAKNHKELYHYVEKNPTDKKYPYLDYTLDPSMNFGEGIKVQSIYYVKGNYLKTNESVDDLPEDMNEATKVTFHYDDEKDLVSPEDFKKIEKFANKLETFLNDDIDTIYDEMVVSVDETGYGYNINVTFDNRLLGSNPSKIISKIVNFIVERNGEYSDLVHYNNKVTGDYKLVFSYKGQLNECAIIGPDETDIDSLRANELSRALNSEQPLVDPYDIRCTIRPVFVRKDQFLFDGSTVYKATANASTDKDSGTTEIKVDVLLSNDPDITDASTTLTLPTEFDGLKLLRGNPTKVYNESADVKADTVTLSFANEDEANEFIKDNGVKPEKSFEGKFGWTVILKKSDLKKIK